MPYEHYGSLSVSFKWQLHWKVGDSSRDIMSDYTYIVDTAAARSTGSTGNDVSELGLEHVTVSLVQTHTPAVHTLLPLATTVSRDIRSSAVIVASSNRCHDNEKTCCCRRRVTSADVIWRAQHNSRHDTTHYNITCHNNNNVPCARLSIFN